MGLIEDALDKAGKASDAALSSVSKAASPVTDTVGKVLQPAKQTLEKGKEEVGRVLAFAGDIVAWAHLCLHFMVDGQAIEKIRTGGDPDPEGNQSCA